jgi:hypothetical protein
VIQSPANRMVPLVIQVAWKSPPLTTTFKRRKGRNLPSDATFEAPNNGRSSMMKYAAGAALLVAFTAPGLATSSSTTTTTTTTGGSATSTTDQFYVVRDPSTRRCTVVTGRPTSGTTVVVGDTVYTTRSGAESSVTKVCQ